MAGMQAATFFDFLEALDKQDPNVALILSPSTMALEALQKVSKGSYKVISNLKTLDDLLKETEALSLFSHKMYFFLSLKDLKKEHLEYISKNIEDKRVKFRLLIHGQTCDKKNALYQKVERFGVLFNYQKLKPWDQKKEIEKWISFQFKTCNVTIEYPALEWLIYHVGMDYAAMQTEIDKLFCFIADRKTVILKDIESVVFKKPSQTLWNMSEALLSKQREKALETAYQLLEGSETLSTLLSHLLNVWQQALDMRFILSKEGALAVQQKYISIPKKLLDKKLKLLQTIESHRLKQSFNLLVKAQYQTRLAQVDPFAAIDLLFYKLVSL